MRIDLRSDTVTRPTPAMRRAMADAEVVRGGLRPGSPHLPTASLVCVENTHNPAGGKVTPLAELRAIRRTAGEHALPVHLDGARLWNAAAASGVSLAELAACRD